MTRSPAIILAEMRAMQGPLSSDRYMETFDKFVKLWELSIELADALSEQVADAVCPIEEE